MNDRRERFSRTLWRWVWLAAAVGLGGCYDGADDSDADAGSVCEPKSTCNECLDCARANPCADLVDSCRTNSACVAIDSCIPMCQGDLSCEQGCYTGNPSGATTYQALDDCLYCEQCPNDCSGYRDCD
jgi:hypothetical protein